MIAVWSKRKLTEYNTRLAFQIKCNGADEIRLIALDYYRIFIDGKFVGFGPARTAKGFARVDRYDVSSYHDFVVTVEVLCYNIPGYSVASKTPLFGAEILKDGNIIAESTDFTAYSVGDYVRKTQKYSFQRGFAEEYDMEADRANFYLGKPFFDREEVCEVKTPTLLSRNVDYPTYEPVASKKIEYGGITRDPSLPHWYESWQMENNPRLNFCFERTEIREIVSDTVSELSYEKRSGLSEVLSENSYFAYDFSRIQVGFLAFETEALEDSEIYLVWSETANFDKGICDLKFSRNDCCDIIKFTLKKGKYSLQTFEPYCARFVKILCLKGRIKPSDVHMISYENKNKNKLRFTCENKNLELIFNASQATLAHNAVDLLTDCPGRERAGWLCDSFFIGKTEFLLFGNNKTEKNFLENYVIVSEFDGYPEGMVPMCYPSDVASRKYIPNWALWFILELQDYYSRTNDVALIERMKAKAYGVLKYFQQYENEDGLLENLSSWVFVEWSKANEYTYGLNFPTNMLYAAALKSAGELYGDEQLVQKAIRNNELIISYSFNGEFFVDNAVRDETGKLVRTNNITETCQYYALFFDLAQGERFSAFRDVMLNEFGHERDEKVYPEIAKSNAFIGNYLRLAYLLRAGKYRQVLQESEQYFTYMAKQTGTLWEHDAVAKSLDHGFGSYAACLIIESLQKSKAYAYELSYGEEKECATN